MHYEKKLAMNILKTTLGEKDNKKVKVRYPPTIMVETPTNKDWKKYNATGAMSNAQRG